ncbi:tagatose 1,6-diphosphate aldolase [Martelella sp. HB161492]|uniref:tagatose 1,6-diphosphate aldolase n=1 Tax=Martelella sp. HB161492 TaxID=2720726 RepID=UPI00159090E6|nr:tagatose 1,6-diphosphate aldolase [Martelella sp. HB161492]
MMEISPGKYWGLRRLADSDGRFRILAMDQTGPIVNPIRQARKLDAAPFEDVAAVKRMLARHLAPHASAVLIDPPLGYAAGIRDIPASRGLLIANEWATWEVTETGRKSASIPGWDPALIRRIGGDAVKINLWYRPDVSPEVKAHQLAYLETVKRACRLNDIAFVLEFLVYPLPGESAAEFDGKRPELIAGSLSDTDIMDPQGVDLYKLEPPIAVSNVPDPDGPQAAAAQVAFDRMARHVHRPWLLLSGGSSPENFLRLLTFAYRAGASGYLAGRAIWAKAFSHFPDLYAMEVAMQDEAPRFMDRFNRLTEGLAMPWHAHAHWQGMVEMVPDGERFAASYSALLAPDYQQTGRDQ